MQTVSSSKFHTSHLAYIRNSRAISVLWGVFTVCFVIINIVVFLQPWLANTTSADKEGYFGLFESCVFDNQSRVIFTDLGMPVRNAHSEYRFFCEGNWKILWTAVNPAATFFVGISALLNLICIATFLVLFLFVNPTLVFTICGALQGLSAVCMLLGCIVYPAVWGSDRIREVCETSENFVPGKCEIKWAYILAILGIFDILLLSILALVLSRRQVSNFKNKSGSYRQQLQPVENSSFNTSNNDFRVL